MPFNYDVEVKGYTVRVEVRQQAGFFPPRYAAQVSCPLDDCECFYNAENKRNRGVAKTAVKTSLIRHLESAHSIY